MEAQDDQENNGSSEKGVPLSSSKLKVKLKISKLMEDASKVNVVVGRDEDAYMKDENKVGRDEDAYMKDENKVQEEKTINLFEKQKKEHICSECGKEFSSGKALGGHMSSAHVQANQRLEESLKKRMMMKKNFSSQDKSLMMKRFEEDYDDDEEEDIGDGDFDNMMMMGNKIICDLCGKNFPSKKSLFGHMRCHPDRDWRGMKPPATSKKNTKNGGFRDNFQDEDEEDDDDDDRFDVIRDEEERSIDVNVVASPPLVGLKSCLKSWDVKDRRGRSPLAKKRGYSSSSSDDKELRDAVHLLLRLVNDVNNNNNNNNSEVMCSSNSVCSAPYKEASFNSLKDKFKRKATVDNGEEKNRGETCSDSPAHKKRRREKELIKLEPGLSKDLVLSPVIKKSTPEVKYKCNICDKIFASHQALGGHRSSHNKFKISIENTIDHHHHQDQEIYKARNQEDNTQDHKNVQLGEQEINNCNNIDNNVHKCKICDKIFPTGQALGGHQRSHWTNNNQDESSSSQIASKVLDFDLNELPDLDDDYYR